LRPKPWWLVVSFISGFLCAMFAEELAVHWRNDELRVTAPKLHFLTGAALNRLKNGATAPFDFQLTLWKGSRSTVFDRVFQRFVVSYDVWEEKFFVTARSDQQRWNRETGPVRLSELRRSTGRGS
jgi:hypothetical protein